MPLSEIEVELLRTKFSAGAGIRRKMNPRRLEVFMTRGKLIPMLTDKDINKLIKVFPTKVEVEQIVEEKVGPLRELVVTGMDRLATAIEKQNMENASRDIKLSRHDGWIHKIAKETKVRLAD